MDPGINRLFQFSIISILLFLLNYTNVSAQTLSLDSFIDSALSKNPDLIILSNLTKYNVLEIDKIKAENNSPKMYLSADYLFAPYFNNNGQPVTINPGSGAIGYDIGITNGGLYSALYNVEYPIFNRKQTAILVKGKETENIQLKLQIEILKNDVKHKITNLFFEAWRSLVNYQNAIQIHNFLTDQMNIVKQLTEKGIFRYVDYRLMEIELNSNSIQLEKLKSDYKTNLNDLRKNCGISDSSLALLENKDIVMTENINYNPLFLKSYSNDSLSAIIQQSVFNNRYKPQIHAFANTGLNAVTVNDIQQRFGLSAGLQLTYTFYDGQQKSINWQQEQILIDQSSELKFLKSKELISQKQTLKNSIESAKKNLVSEQEIITEYGNLISIYQSELLQAQISIIEFLNVSKNYYEKRLTLDLHKIDLNELINEYNYWNQ